MMGVMLEAFRHPAIQAVLYLIRVLAARQPHAV